MTAAELSIGLRLAHGTRADVQRAVRVDRSLVKTFGPRGTVYLLPARDLPMWTTALSAAPRSTSSHPEGVRLTDEQTEAVVAAIADAVMDGELTIDELTEAVVERTGPWAGDPVMDAFQGKWPRWRQVLPIAGIRGAVCFGPDRGRRVTYTSPRRLLPPPVAVDARSALVDLVRIYLSAYGPATPQMFAHWLNAPSRWAAQLFDSLAGDLEPVDIEGRIAYAAAGDVAAPSAPPRGVHLLPYFDSYAYVVGNHPRELLYPGGAADRVRGNFPVLVVNGVVAGVWHVRRSGRWLDITVEPLTALTTGQHRELGEQVARVGEVLEGVPRLTMGHVAVGGHA